MAAVTTALTGSGHPGHTHIKAAVEVQSLARSWEGNPAGSPGPAHPKHRAAHRAAPTAVATLPGVNPVVTDLNGCNTYVSAAAYASTSAVNAVSNANTEPDKRPNSTGGARFKADTSRARAPEVACTIAGKHELALGPSVPGVSSMASYRERVSWAKPGMELATHSASLTNPMWFKSRGKHRYSRW